MNNLKVSVIIPTYNDPKGINECLNSLKKQTLSKDEFEVIVVDNNKNLSEYDNIDSNVVILHEIRPGSYTARNTALDIARGKYIAFTDSDCSVAEDWLEKGLCRLALEVTRVAGKIKLYDSNQTKSSIFAKSYEKAFAFNQKEYAERGESVTANLMIHKAFIEELGKFDEKLFSGGDIEWNKRASKKKIPIVYAEEVVVFHPTRATLNEIISKRLRVLGGQYEKLGMVAHLKFLIPPVKEIRYLYSLVDMSFREKLMSWSVRYLLKLISFFYILLLKLGLSKPRRV